MKIEKIHIKEIDDSFPLLYPTRSIEITTDKGTVITPNRGATGYEFNRKKILPSEITIENSITIHSKKFTGGEVAKLVSENGEYRKLVNAVDRSDHVTEYSTLHLCSFQLASMAKNFPAPMVTLAREENLNNFLSAVIEMQLEPNHDIISIPHFDLPFSQLQQVLKMTNDSIQKLDKEAMFTLDLRYPQFTELLDYVAEEFQSKIISLVYRKYRDVRHNYRHLRNYARRDIAFLMTEVERADLESTNLSTMHYLPFLGNDIYAVELPPPNIPEEGKPPKPKNPANIKVMNRNELTIESFPTKSTSNTEILEELGNVEYDKLSEKLSNIDQVRTDDRKYDIVNALTRIHELKVSTEEFMLLQEHINDRSSNDYVRKKRSFQSRLPPI